MGKKKHVAAIALFLTLCLTNTAFAGEGKADAEANPLKEEMRLLNKAFKNLMDSLVLHNPASIEAPVREVLEAKEKTEAALEEGKIMLPRNNDKMELFKELDTEFHMKLEKLVELSKKGDMPAIQEMAHELLDGCVGCHNDFRH